MAKRAWADGPWKAVPELLKVVCGEKRIVSVHLPKGAHLKSGPYEEAEANARLIAAAPDLFEALQIALHAIDGLTDRGEAMTRGLAALAKADGNP